MKRPIVFLGLVLGLALALVLMIGWAGTRSKARTKAQNVPAPAVTQTPVPQHVIYHAMFRHVVWSQAKADELERQGQDGLAYRNRYQMAANLTDQENLVLHQTATDIVNQVKAIDKQIEAVVKADRAERAKNRSAGLPSAPPPINPELLKLDEQRKSIIIGGYIRLRDSFEPARFVEFEKFVKDNIASQITPINPALQRFPREMKRSGLIQTGGNK
jgi:hypothetical protein